MLQLMKNLGSDGSFLERNLVRTCPWIQKTIFQANVWLQGSVKTSLSCGALSCASVQFSSIAESCPTLTCLLGNLAGVTESWWSWRWLSCSVLSNSWDPMDCSPPGSSVHRILQVRILEWVAISFSKGSSWPRGWTQVSCIAGRFFLTNWATRETAMDI